MRKLMTKEVTSTIVKVAKIDMVEGQAQVVELPSIILLGNVDSEKAQKIVAKQHGAGVTVLGVECDTKVYELEVSEFIKIARLREAGEIELEDEQE
jgi:competence protein ComGC